MQLPSDESDIVHSRLSGISTIWTMLAHAHEPAAGEAATARLAFVQRYQRAAYRYLLAAVRDADAADELFQELVLRFVRGSFRHAHPGKGRFRDYLKTTLSHLIVDYHRQRQRLPRPLEDAAIAAAAADEQQDADAGFQDKWREELFEHAWERLRLTEETSGTLVYSVLRCRTEHPADSSSDIARRVTDERNLKQPMTADNARKLLQRARQQFADHLLDEVAASLQRPTDEEMEQELIELNLLQYCRSAWQRRVRQ